MKRERPYRDHRGGKIIFGLVIAFIGVFFLLHRMDIVPDIDIATTWPFFLIGLGLLIGIKNRFRNHAWWILIAVGVVNSIDDFPIIKEKNIYAHDLVWPGVLIVVGLFIALKPRRKMDCRPKGAMQFHTNDQSVINIDVTFGGRKEIVTSKEFRGGMVQATFGGVELNLMQADTTHKTMEIDVKVSFGGVEIIVPSHWEVKNELRPAFGGVEDHRLIRTPNAGEERKTLIIRGSVSFGSVDIKSY